MAFGLWSLVVWSLALLCVHWIVDGQLLRIAVPALSAPLHVQACEEPLIGGAALRISTKSSGCKQVAAADIRERERGAHPGRSGSLDSSCLGGLD